MENTYKRGCVSVKLYLQKQAVGCSLLTPVLNQYAKMWQAGVAVFLASCTHTSSCLCVILLVKVTCPARAKRWAHGPSWTFLSGLPILKQGQGVETDQTCGRLWCLCCRFLLPGSPKLPSSQPFPILVSQFFLLFFEYPHILSVNFLSPELAGVSFCCSQLETLD